MSLSKSGPPEPGVSVTGGRRKILWLVSWYPNRYDPFDGDFIQRHARAAALYNDITVLFVKQETAQGKPEKVEHCQEGLTERLIYLPKKQGLAGRIFSLYQWRNTLIREAAFLVKKEQPYLVHVHIPWKVGLIAIWLCRKYNLPYLVTEHWGIYNNVVNDHIHTRSPLFRQLLRRIYQKATTVISVSRFLGEGINRSLLSKPFTVIPNVVDTALFFPAGAKADRFTFLHVSNMVPLKNVEGILRAFRRYLDHAATDAQLILIGNKDDEFLKLAREIGLPPDSVFFRGEMPYTCVAGEMQKAHVLVVNSDMENSPCVIGEALCCGLPVIATDVGGIPELVTSANGLFIPPRNVDALAEAFKKMQTAYPLFDPEQIAKAAHQTFSMEAVGKKFHRLYREILPSKPPFFGDR